MFQIKNPFRHVLQALVTAVFLTAVTACTAGGPVIVLPQARASKSSSTPAALELTEYPLVEQSQDNPTHLSFLDRVSGVVNWQRKGPLNPSIQEKLVAPNRILSSFGFRLEVNPGPPYTGYALFRSGKLLVRDIARFWPVSLSPDGEDFLFPFETFSGDQMVASLDGLEAWPGIASADTGIPSAPVDYGEKIAYTSAETDPPKDIQDGKDPNPLKQPDEIFDYQLVNGQSFTIFSRDGVFHLNFAGRDLPYVYDQVVHNQAGELSVFNPSGEGNVMWFFALRDGLWYYVELTGGV